MPSPKSTPTPEKKAKLLFGHPAMLGIAAAVDAALPDEMYAKRLAELGRVERPDVAAQQLDKLVLGGLLERVETPRHDPRVLYRKRGGSAYWSLARKMFVEIHDEDVRANTQGTNLGNS